MASTSTSSFQKSFKYDVFLSFRGEDTRHNFVSHLYNALEQHGIQTYKDDKKIEKGETIDTQLMESIEDSRFFIIVFSKDYAGSSWCLDELVKIMECQETSEQTAYPVFYDVEPTEICEQSGVVGEAFKRHENEEAAGKWRKALNEAGNLAGWELKMTANGDESELIKEVVDDIFKKIWSISSSVDGDLVGMETRIEAVLSSLELDAQEVRMIGIWGMGGGGKTTLARAVFDRISIHFDGKAFVENVREVSKSSLYGLNKLQQQILSSVLSEKDITVSSVHEGTNMMKRMIRGRKVLVVLDDVDDIEQLEALAGEPEWFKFGSRVIITTRDKQVLSAHGVKFINDVNLLSPTEAICLLSKYAFKRDIPIEGYEELSKEVVQYADGLPLTIKVLGSLLCSQNVPQWKDTLERLKKIPLKATMEKLELSYNSLEEDYKEIFLDVACFLKGRRKDNAILVLESCGFYAEAGLRVLEQRSLINISEYGMLDMHDHIEEMGKNIVRRVNPNKPERHSRLWIKEEIVDILANDMGSQATKCIELNAPFGLNFDILMNGLANMKELRFLDVNAPYVSEAVLSNWNFDEDSLYLPNALRFLYWYTYPFSSLPKTFQAKNLVRLEMLDSNIVQLWKDGEEKACSKLRFLKFTFSKLRTLDLSVAPNLETLILENCHDLVEVRFQVTPNLKDLRIYHCNRLEKLHMPAESPKLRSLYLRNLKLRTLHLGITPNLEGLSLYSCIDMVELHMPAESPKLSSLDVSNLKLRTLHLGMTPNLCMLRLYHCIDMVELHMPAESPKLRSLDLSNLKLRTLHLGITPNLQFLRLYSYIDMVEFHMSTESPKLVNLNLTDLKLKTLHLGINPNLEYLSLKNCSDLVELHITYECPKLETLHLNDYAKLRTLDLGLIPNLQSLYLNNCYDLEGINAPAESLKKLFYLCFTDCGRFKSFKFDKIDSPDDVSLSELHLIADIIWSDPNNNWPEFQFWCDYKEDPDSSFGNLERLISLGFGARINVDSFSEIICGLQCLRKLTLEGGIPEVPKNLDQLDCLEELSLRYTNNKTLPDSICLLKHLKSLELDSCFLLEKLPVNIGKLECLESLILFECTLLQDIPNSIYEMKRLKCLELARCIQVEKLPEEIGRLEYLKELNILGSGISHLPESLYGLRGLRIIGDRWLLESCGLTPKRRRMSDEDSDLNDELSDEDDEWSATYRH